MTPSGERYRETFRFGPVERRGIVGGLRPGQVALVGSACLFGVAVFRRSPDLPGLAVATITVLGACAATWVPVAGRTIDEWTPVFASWLVAMVGGGTRHRSGSPFAGTSVRGGRHSRPTPPLPAPLERTELLVVPLVDERELGLFADRKEGTYTAVARVRVRSFGLLAAVEQERRLERWGRMLAALAREGGPVRRIQVMERTLPHDGDQLSEWLEVAGDRSVADDAPARRSYGQLLDSAAEVTQDHEVLVAVQIDPRRARSAGADTNRDDGAAQLAIREMRALAERLEETDAGIAGLLTPELCGWTVRLAYEPYLRTRSSRAATPPELGPTAADASWDRYRTDGAVHRSYWIAQWPRLEVGPAFLAPLLLSPTAVRSFSVVIEPVPPARARSAIEAAVTSDEADEQLRGERGFRTTARRRKQQSATRQREAELAEGHEELRFAGFITVSARNDEELEAATRDVCQASQQAYLDLQPMWGQQDVGFVCGALPLCHGLAPARLIDR